MKKKLENAKGLWPKLPSEVLWVYRTTPKMSIGETPYSLVYETDAVIPVEVGEPSLRYSHESGPTNGKNMRQDLDEVEKRRDMAYIKMVAQKQQAKRYYNKKVKVSLLKVGDFYVLKAKTQAGKESREGKLGTNWDGPYKITEAASKRKVLLRRRGGRFELNYIEGADQYVHCPTSQYFSKSPNEETR
uniref:Uncharacterized protein LOC104248892 n=1 Tax=Nicotiana sylvestris TaxID=4096 RepID=A0A1U7YWJ2_NICSY|nr:PREDICTED: uncharacterized protein LOC104248892 [Nicotiana sylvestris]